MVGIIANPEILGGKPVVEGPRLSVEHILGLEEGRKFYTDRDILARTHARHRFVLTHDPDFGRLAIHRRQPITGIIHLRPGSRPAAEVIADLQTLLEEWKIGSVEGDTHSSIPSLPSSINICVVHKSC